MADTRKGGMRPVTPGGTIPVGGFDVRSGQTHRYFGCGVHYRRGRSGRVQRRALVEGDRHGTRRQLQQDARDRNVQTEPRGWRNRQDRGITVRVAHPHCDGDSGECRSDSDPSPDGQAVDDTEAHRDTDREADEHADADRDTEADYDSEADGDAHADSDAQADDNSEALGNSDSDPQADHDPEAGRLAQRAQPWAVNCRSR